MWYYILGYCRKGKTKQTMQNYQCSRSMKQESAPLVRFSNCTWLPANRGLLPWNTSTIREMSSSTIVENGKWSRTDIIASKFSFCIKINKFFNIPYCHLLCLKWLLTACYPTSQIVVLLVFTERSSRRSRSRSKERDRERDRDRDRDREKDRNRGREKKLDFGKFRRRAYNSGLEFSVHLKLTYFWTLKFYT